MILNEGAELCGKVRLPRLASLCHLTADKRLRCASPKLLSVTSFIRKMLSAIAGGERIQIMKKRTTGRR